MSITLNEKINLKSILKIDEKEANKIISDINQDTIKIILENEYYDINRLMIKKYIRENDLKSIFEIFCEYSITSIRDLTIQKIKKKTNYYNNEVHKSNYSISNGYSCYDY